MADKIFVRPGTNRGSLNEDYVMFRDNGDGSFSLTEEARLRGWDVTDLVWTKLLVDHTTGALKVQEAAGLVPKLFDYISYTSASTTDTYVYKTGGSGGTTVATVTVTWTDSNKTTLSSVART